MATKTSKSFQDPFAKLFGSVARVRLLRLFLFNPKKSFTEIEATSHSRIAGAGTRRELRMLIDAGFVHKSSSNPARYNAETNFPFLLPLREMLLNAPLQGNDVYARVRSSGIIKLVAISGIFVDGADGRLDILVVGDRINERRLNNALKLLEADIGTELQFSALSVSDFMYRITVSDRFIRDVFDYPHRIVFDKLNIGLK